MQVLIVSQVERVAQLRRDLDLEGIEADVAVRVEDVLWMAKATNYDAILIDGTSKLAPARAGHLELRRVGVWRPVPLLTAVGALPSPVERWDPLAETIVEPCPTPALATKLRALARRPLTALPPTLAVGSLRLDPVCRQVWRGETQLRVSGRELELLEVFMRHPGRILSRDELLTEVWTLGEVRSNVVEAYVRYLRRKIDAPFSTASIETVRHRGYRLRTDGGQRAASRTRR